RGPGRPLKCTGRIDVMSRSAAWQESTNRSQKRQETRRRTLVPSQPRTIMNVDELKAALVGKWVSIAPEVRPSKNPDGTLKPFFLTRSFAYLPEDRFELTVMNYAEAFGK